MHDESMRIITWGNKKEKMRTRLGCHFYHMRRWLILLWCSQSLSSYPLPMSMLTPWGIDRNSNPDLWDGCTNPISLFRWNNIQEIDVNNIMISLRYILDFISNKKLKNNREENILFLSSFGQIAFNFVFFLFKRCITNELLIGCDTWT